MTIETGYECPTPGVLCNMLCGNGRQDPGEQCDDHNNASSDGCSSTCQIEVPYKCPIWGSPW